MNIRVVISSSFVALFAGVLGACAAPVDSATIESQGFEQSLDQGTVGPLDWNNGNNGNGNGNNGNGNGNNHHGRWTPKYASAVAEATATAKNGGSATATATAFADELKRNGWWREPCAATAIAIATAVAEDSCGGGKTIATAVATATC
jgi:hypothetical protein